MRSLVVRVYTDVCDTYIGGGIACRSASATRPTRRTMVVVPIFVLCAAYTYIILLLLCKPTARRQWGPPRAPPDSERLVYILSFFFSFVLFLLLSPFLSLSLSPGSGDAGGGNTFIIIINLLYRRRG